MEKKNCFHKLTSFILLVISRLKKSCISANSLFPGTKMKLDAGMEQSPGYSILLVIFL